MLSPPRVVRLHLPPLRQPADRKRLFAFLRALSRGGVREVVLDNKMRELAAPFVAA